MTRKQEIENRIAELGRKFAMLNARIGRFQAKGLRTWDDRQELTDIRESLDYLLKEYRQFA